MIIRRLSHLGFGLVGAVTAVLAGFALTPALSGERGSQWRLGVSALLFAIVPLISLWLRPARRRAALLAIWSGTAIIVLAFAAFTPAAPAQAAMLLYLGLATMALLVGAVIQALLEVGASKLRAGRHGGNPGTDSGGLPSRGAE